MAFDISERVSDEVCLVLPMYNVYNTDMSLHAYFDVSIECKQLRSIVLLNVKRVSDVGIRCIASCQHLEALNGM